MRLTIIEGKKVGTPHSQVGQRKRERIKWKIHQVPPVVLEGMMRERVNDVCKL